MPKIDTKTLENEVRNIIAEIVEVDPEKIKSETSFVNKLGMDSMMSLEILGTLEKRYKIKIPEENLTKITNLKSIIELLEKMMD